MNDVQMEKAEFTKVFAHSLRMADLGVRNARYRLDGAMEYVDLTFDNGHMKTVNVTGDSCKAIMLDVLKRV